MSIPVEARVLSWIFEYRMLLYLCFWIAWAAVYIGFFKRPARRVGWSFFIVSAVLFLLLQLLCVHAGWRFRMELRDRFAAPPETARRIAASPFRWAYGERDAYAIPDVRLSRMPPEIRQAYAERDQHPRVRDRKAMLAGFVPSAAILVFLQWAVCRASKKRGGD